MTIKPLLDRVVLKPTEIEETTKSGFYNVDKFSRHQTLHFAIGYPF